jgi:hypothetical protein
VTVVGGDRRAGDPNHPDCPNHPHAPCQARHAGESSLIRSDARAILLPHGLREEQTAGHPWQESRIGTGGQPGSPLGTYGGQRLTLARRDPVRGAKAGARSRSGAARVVRPAIRQSNWAFSVVPRSPVSPTCAVPANPDQRPAERLPALQAPQVPARSTHTPLGPRRSPGNWGGLGGLRKFRPKPVATQGAVLLPGPGGNAWRGPPLKKESEQRVARWWTEASHCGAVESLQRSRIATRSPRKER